MQFTFTEPPVWNMAAPGKPTHEPSLLQVNLCSMKPKDETPIAVVSLIASMPPSSIHPTMEHPSMTTELQELLSWAMPDTSDPVPGHTVPKRSPLVTLGSQPFTEEEGSQQSESMDAATPALAVTLTPGDNPCASTVTPALPVSPAPKTIQVVFTHPSAQHFSPSQAG